MNVQDNTWYWYCGVQFFALAMPAIPVYMTPFAHALPYKYTPAAIPALLAGVSV